VSPVLAVFLLHAVAGGEPPSPREVLGYDPIDDARPVGADGVEAYLAALADASPGVRIESIGLSTDGRAISMAAVSLPENLDLPPGREPPVAVLITCSIHSDEVCPSLVGLRLLHRLASGRTPGAGEILRNLVVLVFPGTNPDGLDLVRETAGRDPGGALPALYQRFTGHDNNRDWTLLTQVETRAFARTFSVHRPRIWIDVHQMGRSGPRLFLPPYSVPRNPRIPGRLLALAGSIGAEVRAELEASGLEGIDSASGFDAWAPARFYPFFHGAVRLLIEAAGADLFRPVARTDRPWGIPEIAGHLLAAIEASLRRAAARTGELRGGAGGGGPRRAIYRIPAEGNDPWAVREVLEALRLGGAEIRSLEGGWEAGTGAGSPEGLDGWIRSLLGCTPYPAGAGNYDGTCHDLAHLAGVRVVPIEEEAGAGREPAERGPERVAAPPGTLLPGHAGGRWIIDGGSLGVLREVPDLVAEGFRVLWTSAAVETGGRGFPPGSILVEGAPRAWIARIAAESGATAAPGPDRTPPSIPLGESRIGVLRGPRPSIDEGWTRWVLEDFRIPFRSVVDARRGLAGIDVLVVPEGSLPSSPGGERECLIRFAEGGGRIVGLGAASRELAALLDLPLRPRLDAGGRHPRTPGVLLRAAPAPAGAGHPVLQGLGPEVPLYFQGGPCWDAEPPARALLLLPRRGLAICGLLPEEEVLAGAAPLVEAPIGRGSCILAGFRPQFRGWTLGSVRILLAAVLLGK